MGALAETYLKIGFAGLVAIVFLYLYIYNVKKDSKQDKTTNETLTNINQKIFDLFVNEIKSIDGNVMENKKLNKDITVIQAQIHKNLLDHDKYSREAWEKFLPALEKLCETMNGSNPKIVAIQKEIENLKKQLEK